MKGFFWNLFKYKPSTDKILEKIANNDKLEKTDIEYIFDSKDERLNDARKKINNNQYTNLSEDARKLLSEISSITHDDIANKIQKKDPINKNDIRKLINDKHATNAIFSDIVTKIENDPDEVKFDKDAKELFYHHHSL